jgi:RecA-family ATPase
VNASAGTPLPAHTAALDYAARGWPVFPAMIDAEGKKKSRKSAEFSDGRRWGATTDPNEIRRDFSRWPDALVGIVTGPESGLFVVEADTDKAHGVDGIGSINALIQQHGPLPATIEAVSPSGSWHVYFRWPEAGGIRNSTSLVAPGIDVRGEGGMIIAPPSVRPGKSSPYSWANPPGLFDLADCPEWLLAMCRKKLSEGTSPGDGFRIDAGSNGWAAAALRDEFARLLSAPVGTRNDILNAGAFNLAQIIAGGALEETDVRARLLAAALAIGLPEEEALTTIESGFAAGLKFPRGPKEPKSDAGKNRPAEGGANLSGGTAARAGRFYSAAELKGRPVPPREWLVDGLVPMKNVTLLSGDGGTGKSLLAHQLGISVAAGGLGCSWLGMPTRPGRVIYLSCEDDDEELHRRSADILRHHGLDYDDIAGMTIRSLAGEDALLAVDTKVALVQTELFAELEARAADEQPALIILDTLADVYPANENDRAKVRQFIGIVRGLAIRQQCAVLLLGHPSLTGLTSGTGTSGSTAWNNSVRSRLYLERIVQDGYEPDPDRRILTTKKANYGRVGGEIAMRWCDGLFDADAPESTLDRRAAGMKAERVFLKLLRLHTDQGRRVNASGGSHYAPKLFAEHPDSEGCTKKALRSAMERLLADGKLVNQRDGPPSRRVSCLVEVGHD